MELIKRFLMMFSFLKTVYDVSMIFCAQNALLTSLYRICTLFIIENINNPLVAFFLYPNVTT